MKRLPTLLVNIAAYAIALAFLLPLLWLVWAAGQCGTDLFASPLSNLHWSGTNFAELHHRFALFRWLTNSLFIASAQSVISVVISSMAGFALAKYRFRSRHIAEFALLGSLLLPPQLLLPANYETIAWLELNNTFAALLLPGCLSIFGIFLMRQAMLHVPDELLDAARIDGASELRVWWTIALPLARPMTAAVTLLSFLGAWNNYLWPQVVLQDENKFTLPLGLANLSGLSEMQTHLPLLMAAALVGIIPPIILFFTMQRDFVQGLSEGSLH